MLRRTFSTYINCLIVNAFIVVSPSAYSAYIDRIAHSLWCIHIFFGLFLSTGLFTPVDGSCGEFIKKEKEKEEKKASSVVSSE